VEGKEGWLFAFTDELRRLRPHLSFRFAWTVGLQHYEPDIDPVRAARAYHARQRKTEPPASVPTKKRSK
jgi:hypothetical protein